MTQNNLVTKADLKRELKLSRQEMQKEFNSFGHKLEKGIVGEVLGIKDGIMKELRNWRENDEVHQMTHTRINDDLAELDERVRTLEQKTT